MVGGVVVTGAETGLDYTLRLGVKEGQLEGRTEEVFGSGGAGEQQQSCRGRLHNTGSKLGSSQWDCVEQRYQAFTALQTLLDTAYIDSVAGEAEQQCGLGWVEQAMSYPDLSHNHDFLQTIIRVFTPLFTLISFAFTVPLVLKRIVEEKQEGVKVGSDIISSVHPYPFSSPFLLF